MEPEKPAVSEFWPPFRKSSPPPPIRVSSPAPPIRTSLPLVPVMVSLPDPPLIVVMDCPFDFRGPQAYRPCISVESSHASARTAASDRRLLKSPPHSQSEAKCLSPFNLRAAATRT